MQARVRGAVLLLVATFLLILGNKELWTKISEEWQYRTKIRRDRDFNTMKEHEIEVQKLVFENEKSSLRNPEFYFRKERLGNIDFSARKQTKITVEDGSKPENASESS